MAIFSTMTGRPTQGVIDIRVRYAECDPMGVAHHTAYPVWLEMGRTELLRDAGATYRALEDAGILLAVVSLSIRYRRPAKYDDVVTLETRLVEVSRVKIKHEYELRRGDEVLATAESTLACIDRTGRAQPIPESVPLPAVE
jgi:acyl-CoA thioester hydrolase